MSTGRVSVERGVNVSQHGHDGDELVTKAEPSCFSSEDATLDSSPAMASLAESWAFLDQELDKFQKICAELERDITTVEKNEEANSPSSINDRGSQSSQPSIASSTADSLLKRKGPPPPTPPKPPSLGAKPKPPLAPKPKIVISSNSDAIPTSPTIQTNL
ncbi:hypothetical protein TCAL_16881 [Tigriopus californicus]|uniref:Uncharacterized protein n=1 Tax=Tigriopus californicus TaxID=6832 RepID=A0A553P686_TIGCA|nr:WASH complex subunit 3-like [Tigriopus californicus]TRY73199.1 hypothetical protein TCAL_16881 [Tigriopus californicus]